MQYELTKVQDYFLNEYNINKNNTYEVKKIKAMELVKYNRFDILAKWIYIDSIEKNYSIDYGRRIYLDNIRAFSHGLYIEPGNNDKNSFHKYETIFRDIIKNIKNKGFDEGNSIIPVDSHYDAIDGSHRISAASYFNKEVSILVFSEIKRFNVYNYEFFRKNLMSDASLGNMATVYSHIKNNCYFVCVWPKAGRDKFVEVEKIICTVGNIVYSQDVYLTYNGMRNLMIQTYGHQNWTGNIKNRFSGVNDKVDSCYEDGFPIRTYLIEVDEFSEVIKIKKEIRSIYGIDNHSIHISDNSEETNELTELLYNRNSVKFLNKSNPYKFDNIYAKLKILKEKIEAEQLDMKRFVIDSSAVLEVCGLREAKDLDYLTDYDLDLDIQDIDNHKSQLVYYGVSLSDLLYCPDNYFYFEGFKFVTPQNLIKMKLTRGEKKDFRDVKLLKKYIHKKCKIPIDYRNEVIDKIYLYQVNNNIFGQGIMTISQYIKDFIKRKIIKKLKRQELK